LGNEVPADSTRVNKRENDDPSIVEPVQLAAGAAQPTP
jgi:hypothetical protein